MAVPDYFLGVTQHEGLHALAATAFGAKVTSMNVLPSEQGGHFFFGRTTWEGSLTTAQSVVAYTAPKMGELAGLSAYALLELTGNAPENKYAALSLLVVATGMWVDFVHDIGATSDASDVGKTYSLLGVHDEASRFPYRLLHGTVAVAAALPIVRGYVRLFTRRTPATRTRAGAPEIEAFVRGDVAGVRGSF
jgi:hypothetical protein